MSADSRVVVATGNPGKLNEIIELLDDTDIEFVSQQELGVIQTEETGMTFVENALAKARRATQQTGLASIADDSGLEVDFIHGAPGICSARFDGPNATDADNTGKLLAELGDAPSEHRSARFQCVMVYLRHATDPAPMIAQGTWHGRILSKPRGEDGFGYDPIFFVPSHRCSVAELDIHTKNRLSHRGQALRNLVEKLKAEWAV